MDVKSDELFNRILQGILIAALIGLVTMYQNVNRHETELKYIKKDYDKIAKYVLENRARTEKLEDIYVKREEFYMSIIDDIKGRK